MASAERLSWLGGRSNRLSAHRFAAWHARPRGSAIFLQEKAALRSFGAGPTRSKAVTCFQRYEREEVEGIRAYGLRAPVALIPIGIYVPDAVCDALPQAASGRRTLLYLGQSPQEGPRSAGRGMVAGRGSVFQLGSSDCGPSEIGHCDELRAQVRALSLQRVTFHDGLFGKEKSQAYRDADLFVLPTLDENFGMVVAESLANGTPVVCTKGAPWEGLKTYGCGWWIDHGVNRSRPLWPRRWSLRLELKRMGARGSAWIRDFSWARIAADMRVPLVQDQGRAAKIREAQLAPAATMGTRR